MSKVKKRALSLLLAFAMVFTMMPEVPALAAKTVAKAIDISIDTVSKIASGDTITITGSATMSNASASNATSSNAPWEKGTEGFKASSSDADVAKVLSAEIKTDGTFSVKVKGANDLTEETKATITIGYPAYKNSTSTVEVTVEKAPAPEVESVVVSPESLALVPGGEAKEIVANITYKATPTNAEYKPTITWVPSKDGLVKITSNGNTANVQALNTVTERTVMSISATVNGVDSKNTCIVTITPSSSGEVKVESVLLSNGVDEPGKEITWKLSERFGSYLQAVVNPEDKVSQDVTWKSSNPKIAEVNKDGLVMALAKGEVDIIATSVKDDSKSAVCHLTVEPVKISLDFKKLEMVKDNEKIINVELAGYDGSEYVNVPRFIKDANVDFDKAIADVKAGLDENGNATLSVKAIKAGTTSITVTLDSASVKCELTVSDEKTPATDIFEAADKLADAFANGTREEKQEAIDNAIKVATKVDFENPSEVAALEALEKVVLEAFGAILEEPDVDTDETVTNVSFTGVIMNLLKAGILSLDSKATSIVPVLKIEAVDKDGVNIPASAKEKAVAINLELLVSVDGKDPDNLNNLTIPIIITWDIPDSLKDAKNLKIYHYLANGSRETITPVINGDTLTFATKSFSTFVILDAPRSTSGGGGGGRGSSVGGSSSGNLAGSWVQDANGWWFKTTTNGYPASQWAKINNKWYHFNEAGYMQTGWLYDSGAWYWLNADGSMAESTWVNVNGLWYYLHVDGRMLSSQWFLSNGQWYYLNADGSMAVSTTTPDGNVVDANGVWVQ